MAPPRTPEPKPDPSVNEGLGVGPENAALGGSVDPRTLHRKARAVALLSRMQTALNLRKSGASYAQIAQYMKVSQGTAYNLVTAAVRRNEKKTSEDKSQVKALIIERLDTMLMKLWAVISPPPNKPQPEPELLLKITEQICKLDDRRARYEGLDIVDPPIIIDIQEVIRNEVRPMLEGATLEEKRQIAAIMKAQIDRRQAARNLLEQKTVIDQAPGSKSTDAG